MLLSKRLSMSLVTYFSLDAGLLSQIGGGGGGGEEDFPYIQFIYFYR
jgi:hypothetical protein